MRALLDVRKNSTIYVLYVLIMTRKNSTVLFVFMCRHLLLVVLQVLSGPGVHQKMLTLKLKPEKEMYVS